MNDNTIFPSCYINVSDGALLVDKLSYRCSSLMFHITTVFSLAMCNEYITSSKSAVMARRIHTAHTYTLSGSTGTADRRRIRRSTRTVPESQPDRRWSVSRFAVCARQKSPGMEKQKRKNHEQSKIMMAWSRHILLIASHTHTYSSSARSKTK